VGWYRGSTALRSDERAGVSVTRRAVAWSTEVRLAVTQSKPRDAGNYTCRTVSRRLAASVFVRVTPDDRTR